MKYRDPLIGIDVSMHQSSISWAGIRDAGIRYAWIKTSEGTGYTDPAWIRHRAQAEAAGLPWGGYHYARANGPDWRADARAEAEWFVHLGGMSGKLPGVLDMEHTDLDRDTTIMWAQVWCQRVRELSGRMPVLYWGAWFTGSPAAANDPRLADCLWWMPNYGTKPLNPSPAGAEIGWGAGTNGRRVPEIWQYTDRGRVAGYAGDLDLNVAERATILALVGDTEHEHEEDDDMSKTEILWPERGSRFLSEVAGLPDREQPYAFVNIGGRKLKYLANDNETNWQRWVIAVEGGASDNTPEMDRGGLEMREHHNVPDVVLAGYVLVGDRIATG
jgi:lysozyme